MGSCAVQARCDWPDSLIYGHSVPRMATVQRSSRVWGPIGPDCRSQLHAARGSTPHDPSILALALGSLRYDWLVQATNKSCIRLTFGCYLAMFGSNPLTPPTFFHTVENKEGA